jgi:hypothetical protein
LIFDILLFFPLAMLSPNSLEFLSANNLSFICVLWVSNLPIIAVDLPYLLLDPTAGCFLPFRMGEKASPG